MNLFPRSVACILFAAATPALICAADNSDAALRTEALAALNKSARALHAISTEGGYLWRYSPDLKIRGGEGPATATQIWVQPPGTPAVGHSFLRVYAVTRDPFYLSAARDTALALVRGQLESGGWDYKIEFDPAKRAEWRYREANSKRGNNSSTYDDNNTQSALRFLLAYLDTAKSSPDPRDAQIRECLDHGLKKLLEAQYPNGAWPQRWDGHPHDPAKYPVKPASIPTDYAREQPNGSYYGHYTFNDNSHRDLTVTLIDAWHRTGNETYRDAARRAADYLILAQLPQPQPLWAQQYDENLQPAWARAFEPPSITTSESAGVIRLLVDLYLEFGDEKYLKPIPPAIAWLRSHEIAPGRWARLYELGTDKPIYGDRDKKIHYTLAEISEERRHGYGWQGGFGVTDAIAYYTRVTTTGRDAWLAKNPSPFVTKSTSTRPTPRSTSTAKKAAPEIRRLLASLNPAGFWLTTRPAKLIDPAQTEWIETELFIRNTALLCAYLDATSAP
ncbi:pectic acid lyase [Nibricoccus aquaticus]|uniref:Pectic acid lyase n=1 Tax=Nibricoccus aquaticus TaxID=2576891 RepID=A0A290Q3S3_9BACT|nr:pectate lyase [Nibricoccus aquaticus]ATC63325.1 pectic acid lyase [Nibricoccus aquaticus]